MMQFKSKMRGEELRRVSNSDIVYFDHYMYYLRDFVYSSKAQEALFRDKLKF